MNVKAISAAAFNTRPQPRTVPNPSVFVRVRSDAFYALNEALAFYANGNNDGGEQAKTALNRVFDKS